MEVQNEYLPADKQNIDDIDTEEYEHYLGYCVKEGAMDIDEAEEIISNKDWKRVEKMMGLGDLYANSYEPFNDGVEDSLKEENK